jgi:hypothetical protein
MGDRVDDAESGLAEIRATQERLIRGVGVPLWYWWAVAVLTVALGVLVDRGTAADVATGAPVFALVVAALTVWMIVGRGRARVSRDLLGPGGAAWIVGFVAVVVGLSLGVGFGVRAAAVPYPATIATLVAAIALAAGGPLLMRRLRSTMLERRPGA